MAESGQTTKEHFEDLMAQGVALNNQGMIAEALDRGAEAWYFAQSTGLPDTDLGRAARDIGHRSRLLEGASNPYARSEGREELSAVTWLRRAMELHAGAKGRGEIGAEREYRASVGEWGTLCTLWALRREETERTLDQAAVQDAGAELGHAAEGPTTQYRVNFIGRYAIHEALYAPKNVDTPKTIRTAWKLAFRSESPRLTASTPNLGVKPRIRAKGVALGRALVATAIRHITPEVHSTGEGMNTRRRAVARQLARKVL